MLATVDGEREVTMKPTRTRQVVACATPMQCRRGLNDSAVALRATVTSFNPTPRFCPGTGVLVRVKDLPHALTDREDATCRERDPTDRGIVL